jgi:hypothetical protein
MCRYYIFIYICWSIYTYLYKYVHACMHIYIHTYIHRALTNTRTYTRTYLRTSLHTYVRAYINTYIHTYTKVVQTAYGYVMTHAVWPTVNQYTFTYSNIAPKKWRILEIKKMLQTGVHFLLLLLFLYLHSDLFCYVINVKVVWIIYSCWNYVMLFKRIIYIQHVVS